MNITLRHLTALLTLAALTAGASTPQAFNAAVQQQATPLNTSVRAFYTANPAMMPWADSLNLSRISLQGHYLKQAEAEVLQEGTGHILGQVAAESYMHIRGGHTVWGNAAFTTGSLKDIKWSDCIDYDRVGPYVLGDSVGGHMSTRSYEFGGGWAHAYGRFSLGAEAAYRAQVAYRNHDPRVNTVVSDLTLRLGATMATGRTHALGINAALNLYSQTTDVDFYSPLNTINTYPLMGLGAYYKRFTGNENDATAHSATGWAVGAQWLPTAGHKGVMLEAALRGERMNWHFRGYNNLTAAFMDTYAAYGRAAWVGGTGITTLAPEVTVDASQGRGNENLFGSVTAESYPLMGTRHIYTRRRLSAEAGLPVQFNTGVGTYVSLDAHGLFRYQRERYLMPVARVEAKHAGARLGAGISHATGAWILSLHARGTRLFTLNTPAPTFAGSKGDPAHNARMLQCARTLAQVNVGIERSIARGIILGLSADWVHTHFDGNGRANRADVAIALKF